MDEPVEREREPSSGREPTRREPVQPSGPPSRWKIVRGHIRDAFVENAAMKFVAFVLALTVFILVQSEEDVHIGVDVGLSYILPEDRVLVTERPSYVRVTVRGSRRQTRRFAESETDRAYIDLENHRASEYVFRQDLIPLPDGLELVRFTPESFPTEFERRTDKSVPIDVRIAGQPKHGHLVKRVIASPAEVMIRGAESQVTATTGIKTQELRLGDRTESFTTTLPLVVEGQFLDVVDIDEVEVRVEMAEEQGARTIGPLKVKLYPGPAANAEVVGRFVAEPAQVSVVLRGSVLDIEAVDPDDLEAFVEIYTEDVAASRTRKAAVIVRAPEDVAIEISPPEVTIHPPQKSN